MPPILHIRASTLVMLMVMGISVRGQIGISADGVQPDPATLLDINADALPANAKKGVLLPTASLGRAIWSSPAGNPFLSHTTANMPPSLWIYNDNQLLLAGAALQHSVNPGLYWWDTTGDRWIKQQGKVIPVQHHATNSTLTVNADNDWHTLPGLSSVTLQLKAGDRVVFSAHGAMRLPPPIAPSPSAGYANAGTRVLVNGPSSNTVVQQTATSLNGEAQYIFNGTCAIFNLFCSSYTGTYQTSLSLQNWRMVGFYDIPVAGDGAYTFHVQMARLSGVSSVLGGGTSSSNPELRGGFQYEVIRP